MDTEKRFNWLMFLFVLPFALLGGIILLIGARDNERIKAKAKNDSIRTEINRKDSVLRKEVNALERELKTLEDSIHEFEDGM